jgi:hypothetical protein
MTTTLNLATTPLPCPTWCTQPRGHGFDGELPGGSRVLIRNHETTLATIATTGPDGRETNAYVDIYAEETAASNDGPILSSGDPHIVVDGECTHLTGREARRLAEALVAAAEARDEATR